MCLLMLFLLVIYCRICHKGQSRHILGSSLNKSMIRIDIFEIKWWFENIFQGYFKRFSEKMTEKYSLEFFDKTDDYDNISIFQDSRWSSNICWSFRINLTFPPQCPETNLKTAMFLQDHCWWYSCWWQSCLWERRSRRNLWGLGSHRRWSSKN